MNKIHIHAPKGTYYGQIRLRGHRLWDEVYQAGDAKAAMIGAISGMGPNHKRARVLFVADWYEPIIVMELSV
jgi:hypothetical protein